VNGAGLALSASGCRRSRANPWSVYVPPHSTWQVTAATPAELAGLFRPRQGRAAGADHPPSEVGHETRGKGTNTRHVRNILPDTATAESLLVVEVITPGGNWSSYPPHKHDTDDFPRETLLEETYYTASPARLRLPARLHRRRTLDETMAPADGDWCWCRKATTRSRAARVRPLLPERDAGQCAPGSSPWRRAMRSGW